MQLVATSSQDEALLDLVWRFRDPAGRFHLHTVPGTPVGQLLPGLVPLGFAGALVLDAAEQVRVPALVQRGTLEAQEAGAADTVTVTGGGLLADYTFGRAFSGILQHAGWDGRAARAALLGAGPRVRAAARELSSMGAAELTIIAGDLPAAEQSAPPPSATTSVISVTAADPYAVRALAGADLIVRFDASLSAPFEVLGPHLTLIDLVSEELSRLRSQALSVGALSFNRRDFEAHFIALALTQVLGTVIDSDPFLTLLHGS